MSILNDKQIRELIKVGVIENAEPQQVRVTDDEVKRISYGVSSFGYDVRLADSGLKAFSALNSTLIDPKNFDSEKILNDLTVHNDKSGKYVILPPHSYMLGYTIEKFHIPRSVMVICVGKSTYARAGILVNVTPIEAGFKGTVVIEISNSTPLPSKVYLEEGIAQFVFYQGEKCEVSYGDRNGKYQNQDGLVTSRV